MKHLTLEDMVERYYAAGSAQNVSAAGDAAVEKHLEECAECTAQFAAVESDLDSLRPMEIPERGDNYGEQIWSRVVTALPPKAALPVREPKPVRWPRLISWGGLSYAAGCAVLVGLAFYGGTLWENHKHLLGEQARARQTLVTPQPKVVVVILGDHLDRSEQLLVELKHADADDAELVKPMRDEARNLLAANHVFRDDAEKSGDAELTQALNHLDQLLTNIADHPGGLNADAIARLQQEMNSDGLLFEVRVLRAKDPHRNRAVRVVARGGTA